MEETWDERGAAQGARDQAMEASCWCHACCRCCQPPDPSDRGSDRHRGPSWCARGLAQWLVPIKQRAWHNRGALSIARGMAQEMGSGWEGGQGFREGREQSAGPALQPPWLQGLPLPPRCAHWGPQESPPTHPPVCPISTWVPGGRTSSLGTLPWDGDLHLCPRPDFPPLVCTASTAQLRP